MRRWPLRGLLAFVCALLCSAAVAQSEPNVDRLGLVADRISYDADAQTLTASGNVTIIAGERILRTEGLVYDAASGELSISESFLLEFSDGTVISGTRADLDQSLQDGLVEGFRALINEDLVIAARGAQQIDGRYSALTRVVASTCDVCTEDDIPAWQFRAQRVVYDEQTNIVHYENAIFDLFGVPVFFFPYLRHPGPGVDRASGFLAPDLTRSSRYGVGAKLPYFWAIDESRDATITPFITQNERTIIEGEYRQRFDSGALDLYTSLLPSPRTDEYSERWHFRGDGRADLGDGMTARTRVELVSDDEYLSEFGYSRADRLPSSITVDRFQRDGFWIVGAATYTSLREDEKQSEVPIVLPEGEFYEVIDRSGRFGGTLTVRTSAVQLTRTEGRDSSRVSLGGGLERSGPLGLGVLLRGFADLDADIYSTNDDPQFPSEAVFRLRPVAGIEARLPFFRSSDGLSEIIEPVVQLVLAGEETRSGDIPNEDSQQVDFDETNLFARSRFPGEDRYEDGNRIDAGLRYQRITDIGWAATATVGQVFRQKPVDEFASGSGLDGTTSSTVTAVSLDYRDQIGVDARLLTDVSGEIARSEVLGRYQEGRLRAEGSYVFLRDDGEEGTPVDRTEIAFRTAVPLNEWWTAEGAVRRDLEANRYINSRVGAVWRSDCAEVSLSASRDYTRSANVVPTTEYALTFRFVGIGDTRRGGTRRVCAAPQ
ncbi:MAG: LPS assembly protein LptD [Pseudomonadota bacterium]